MAAKQLLAILLSSATFVALDAARNFTIEPRVSYDGSCRCGQKGDSRIVGGQVTGVNEWPWQAAILFQNQQFCGGSLINNRYVLTAAHCVEGLSSKSITVRLGDHRLSTSSETESITKSVSRIIQHPKYESGNEINDIALLRLSPPVQVSDTVLPVCMPPKKPKYARKNAIVTGWGTTSSEGQSSDFLREVTVKVHTNSQCRSSYGTAIKSTMLCAGSTGKDSCQGDSGGPLVFRDSSGNYDQIGVVSWGYGCGSAEYPGVYTRVNSYLSWIRSNTNDGVYCSGMRL